MLTRRQIPNLLTGARVMAVPVALAVILLQPPFYDRWLFGLFLAASLTDFFDGWLARKWHATSPLGALLDPIADKLLVALMLVYFVAVSADPGMGKSLALSLFVPTVVILLRELYISGLREFLGKRGVDLPVSKGGKLKTALQMLGITAILAAPVFQYMQAAMIGSGLIWLAALVALVSAVQYTRASWMYL